MGAVLSDEKGRKMLMQLLCALYSDVRDVGVGELC